MYIPKPSELNPYEQKRKSRRRTYSRKNVYSIGGALLLLAALLLIAAQQHRNGVAVTASSDKLQHDFEQLWNWTDQVLDGGARGSSWTMRWDVPKLSAEKQAAMTTALFRDSKGQTLDKLSKNDGATLIGETGGEFGVEGSLTLQVTEKTEEGAILFVLLETKENTTVTERSLEQWASRVSSTISEIEPDFAVKIKVHGFTEHENATQELKRLSLGQELERYDDDGTVSLTMNSAKLLSSEGLDFGRRANLQIAAHDYTENDLTEMTIGVPFITGDFSDVHQTGENGK
ncbi:YwmB family TATA-box binding protein [Paenibacillus sp. HB172176]|uniref:YwmB family TATA-box binding protein n=1 Tax=Paenibacillus sp. HB172176 TaxID=2493690 RepID=UPI00143B0508|nr:YwmB family TATA-box binding protein [Paenibacillus sp. HB172176]